MSNKCIKDFCAIETIVPPNETQNRPEWDLHVDNVYRRPKGRTIGKLNKQIICF